MPNVVIMADTHLPRGARQLPGELWAAVREADVVLHAGDWVGAVFYDQVRSAARRLLACHGNNDDAVVRAALPEVARDVIGGVRVAVVHETGAAAGRGPRMAARYGEGTDLLVFGHSHLPWDTAVAVPGAVPAGMPAAGTAAAPGGSLRLLNPGSPTDRRRQPTGTWVSARLAGGVVSDLRWHEVPPTAG